MNKTTKSLIISASVLAACFSYTMISNWQQKKTDGFALSKISSSLPFNSNWVTPSLELDEQRELAAALNQEYSYLGSGGQCFAFVSADNKYVIKFFKHFRRKAPFYAGFPMPSSLKERAERRVKERRSKQERDFRSYKIAVENLKEETGLIFVHLNKTKNLRRNLQITDKAGRKFTLNLDESEFVVQKKANLIYPQIEALMAKGEKEKAQALLKNLLSLIVKRSEMGIFDEDARIHRNFGCIGEKVIVIDAGRLRKDPSIRDPKKYMGDIHKITKRLITWLEENYPELKTSLEEEIYALEKTSL